jgi:hypothetical protein
MVLLLAVGPVLLPEYSDQHAGRLDPASVALSLAAILPVVYGIKELAVHGAGTPTAPMAATAIGVAVGVVFEPLTSAVQSQGTIIVDVRQCSEIPAKLRVCFWKRSWVFAFVRLGWCTIGVNGSPRNIKATAVVHELQPIRGAVSCSTAKPLNFKR